jgi:hypothetical protein
LTLKIFTGDISAFVLKENISGSMMAGSDLSVIKNKIQQEVPAEKSGWNYKSRSCFPIIKR